MRKTIISIGIVLIGISAGAQFNNVGASYEPSDSVYVSDTSSEDTIPDSVPETDAPTTVQVTVPPTVQQVQPPVVSTTVPAVTVVALTTVAPTHPAHVAPALPRTGAVANVAMLTLGIAFIGFGALAIALARRKIA